MSPPWRYRRECQRTCARRSPDRLRHRTLVLSTRSGDIRVNPGYALL